MHAARAHAHVTACAVRMRWHCCALTASIRAGAQETLWLTNGREKVVLLGHSLGGVRPPARLYLVVARLPTSILWCQAKQTMAVGCGRISSVAGVGACACARACVCGGPGGGAQLLAETVQTKNRKIVQATTKPP